MSDSGWSFVSLQEQHDQQIHNVIKTQEARIQQATGGMLGWARLGASTTRVQIENSNPLPPPPPLLPPSGAVGGPGSTAAGAPTPPKQRDSKKTAAKEFPRTEEGEKAGREPTKGASFGRRLKTSLLGGKKPVLPSNVTEKERPGTIY
ncbi:hypothetical protein BDV93DRAFT_297435 [Ceratobasidium sp. AG-I]|nr:hypothetical protein BDV93DRAFT_297435 [Ceratobasidium sp. AG-I]